MTTRAKQFDFLLSGLINPTTLSPLAGGLVYFYEAGTTTPKNVWSEKEKTNPFTSITLGSDGTAQYYGEGIYKVVAQTAAGGSAYTWDNVKCESPNYYVRTVSTNTTATTDDDFISVNTDSGNITITLPAAADVTHPLTIKNNGSNDVIVDGSGSETIDGTTTYTIDTEDLAIIFVSNGTNWEKSNDAAANIIDGTQSLGALDVNGNADISGTLNIGSGAERTVVPSGTFSDNSNGNPNVSDTILDVDSNVTTEQWWAIYPTAGSPTEDYTSDKLIWTALDSVPTAANWVRVRVILYAATTSGGAGIDIVDVYARENGSNEAIGHDNNIGQAAAHAGPGTAAAANINEATIQVNSGMFDIHWVNNFGNTPSIQLILIGWGYNP